MAKSQTIGFHIDEYNALNTLTYEPFSTYHLGIIDLIVMIFSHTINFVELLKTQDYSPCFSSYKGFPVKGQNVAYTNISL